MYEDFIVPREILKTSIEHYETVQAKNPRKQFFVSWNWASFFFNFIWLIYRRCYLAAFLSYLGIYIFSMLLSSVVYIVDEINTMLIISCMIGLLTNVIFGMIGDSIYLTAIKNKLRDLSFHPNAKEMMLKKCTPSWIPVIIYYAIVFGILFLFFALIMLIVILATMGAA